MDKTKKYTNKLKIHVTIIDMYTKIKMLKVRILSSSNGVEFFFFKKKKLDKIYILYLKKIQILEIFTFTCFF